VPMLDTRLEFKQHIIDPLVKRDGSGASNLRELLDSVCLRRLNKLLDLPDVNDICEEIEFSDIERPRPEDEVLQNYNTSDSTICDSCKTDLSDAILVNSLCNGHYTTCGHLICSNCLPQFEEALATAKDAKGRVCPLCGEDLPGDYLVLNKAEAMLGQLGRQQQESTVSFQADGVSSKINALLANIEKTNSQDKRLGVRVFK
jgi:hypothetical protein